MKVLLQILCSVFAFTSCNDAVKPITPSQIAGAWSDPKTWGGVIPLDGANISISVGKTIVVDQNINLGNLEILGHSQHQNLATCAICGTQKWALCLAFSRA